MFVPACISLGDKCTAATAQLIECMLYLAPLYESSPVLKLLTRSRSWDQLVVNGSGEGYTLPSSRRSYGDVTDRWGDLPYPHIQETIYDMCKNMVRTDWKCVRIRTNWCKRATAQETTSFWKRFILIRCVFFIIFKICFCFAFKEGGGRIQSPFQFLGCIENYRAAKNFSCIPSLIRFCLRIKRSRLVWWAAYCQGINWLLRFHFTFNSMFKLYVWWLMVHCCKSFDKKPHSVLVYRILYVCVFFTILLNVGTSKMLSECYRKSRVVLCLS